MATTIRLPLHRITQVSKSSYWGYDVRLFNETELNVAEDICYDINEKAFEKVLYITIVPDSGEVLTESYYVGCSLKIAYELFIRAIRQANMDGVISDSVAAFWADPNDTSVVSDVDGSPSNLITKDGTPIFTHHTDSLQGLHFFWDCTNDGEPVFIFASYIKLE